MNESHKQLEMLRGQSERLQDQSQDLRGQSERLQVQSEELRVKSEKQLRLIDKVGEDLRAQSERMQVQSEELRAKSEKEIRLIDKVSEDLRAQSDRMQVQSEELRAKSEQQIKLIGKISADISTKYVDSFPADMDTLICLLESAQHEISILIDVAGYGHWSYHKLFKKYEQLLNRKYSNNVEIHIAMYDMSAWDDVTPRLFLPKDYEEEKKRDPDLREHVSSLKSDPKTEDYWLDLARRLNCEEPPRGPGSIETFEQFIAQLRADEMYYRMTIPGSKILLETALPNGRATHLPLLCWMVDGKRAVYSFIFDRSDEGIRETNADFASLPNSIEATDAYKRYQDTNYEITFITSDPYLIKELKTVMRSYAPSLRIDGEVGSRSQAADFIQRDLAKPDSSRPEVSQSHSDKS